MVYKGKFLKQVVENDFDPTVSTTYTWELSDQALAAIWLTVKGDLYGIDMCIDDFLAPLSSINVALGSMNVLQYTTPLKALIMNCKLKQHMPYLVASTQTATYVTGVSFPLMFGAPYLNDKMCLPSSLSNRKKLTLTFSADVTHLTDCLIDISEVLMIDANPLGFIRQEEIGVESKGTGDHDLWLQTNWDILKMLLYSPTVPATTVYTSTIERAGIEIDDLPFGYKGVPWEHLHAELMDELEGLTQTENHIHLAAGATSLTGMPSQYEHWIKNYGELDYFFEKDLKWKCPTAGASSAKLKYNAGVAEAWALAVAEYVPTSKIS
jgi:hypothetical protein